MMVILFNYRLILFLNTYATRIILSRFVLSDFLSDGSRAIERIKDQLDRILGRILVIKFLSNVEEISGKLIVFRGI